MTYRQVYKVKDSSLIITLPPAFINKQVVVTVDDSANIPKDNLLLMKQAAHDPLYLADLNEVNDDFKNIDHENL